PSTDCAGPRSTLYSRNAGRPNAAASQPCTTCGQPPSPTALAQLAYDFAHGRYALEPVAATIAGIHEHDHRLGDFSADGFGERDRFNDEWLTRFEAVEDGDLSPFERVDRELILAELRGERAVRPFARWRRQPTLYSDTITRGA